MPEITEPQAFAEPVSESVSENELELLDASPEHVRCLRLQSPRPRRLAWQAI